MIQQEKRRAAYKKWYAKNKNINEFIKKKAIYARKRMDEISEWFAQYKATLKCEKCGQNHPATLDFHHINPTEKEFNVSDLKRIGCSKHTILLEIQKCQVLCSNCHRIEHWDGKI